MPDLDDIPAPPDLSELEADIAYVFHDRSLLEMALTLPSYRVDAMGQCPDNQRLEFLGDAVLGLLCAQLLYDAYPCDGEGRLTNLRSQMASGRSLAGIAREINLGAHLRVGRGEERQGGRSREGALADALEAVVGAVWLDGGLDAAREAVLCLVGIPSPDASGEGFANPKGDLQEYVQQNGLPLPVYEVVNRDGPTHAPQYCVRVSCDGEEAEGEGGTKRLAEQQAATLLLEMLRAKMEEQGGADF
ncbi:MAG: ribonuclease III [Kiritimatiellaeota bacterium]|nr:ribonuclease III [Kiritimatiellota bacterium]